MKKVTVFVTCRGILLCGRNVFIICCFCIPVPRFHLNFIKTRDGAAGLGIAMLTKITLALCGTTLTLTILTQIVLGFPPEIRI